MNKSNRSGGIKFRELDYSQNSSDKEQTSKSQLRSREDVLKLFAEPTDNTVQVELQKENNSEDIEAQAGSFEKPIKTEDKSASQLPIGNKSVSPIVRPQTKCKLDIMKDREKIQSNAADTSTVSKNIPSNKKIYNVMVGKISTRKHKQWDSDGILEVTGKSAVLKDVNGKFMGRTTIKPENIEEGFRLCIGGKEIEIVELASLEDYESKDVPTEESESKESVEPPTKKPRITKKFVPVKAGIKK